MQRLVDGLLRETEPAVEMSARSEENARTSLRNPERRDSLEDHSYSNQILEEFLEPLGSAPDLAKPDYGGVYGEGVYLEVCREETVVDTPLDTPAEAVAEGGAPKTRRKRSRNRGQPSQDGEGMEGSRVRSLSRAALLPSA